MKNDFWHQLSLPIIGLSPMDGVTDYPFRAITKKYGCPDVIYTEFTSVEGVCHGADRLLKDFLLDETQHPIIAQIYGTTPDFFRQTAIVLCELGFDGIDINMGCPAKSVAHSGAGASLIKTPQLAQEIIRQTKAGVQDYLNGKRSRDCKDITENIWRVVEQRHQESTVFTPPPISVKTRIGYDQPVIDEWIPTLLEMEPSIIGIHGRTLRQAYTGQAQWEYIAQAAELIHQTDTLILGNGDVQSYQDGIKKSEQYHTDGVLIGRASFGNPFVFEQQPSEHPAHQMAQIALEHAQLYEQTYGQDEKYGFFPMRKHLGWYIKGIENAREIRIELVKANSSEDVRQVFEKFGLI